MLQAWLEEAEAQAKNKRRDPEAPSVLPMGEVDDVRTTAMSSQGYKAKRGGGGGGGGVGGIGGIGEATSTGLPLERRLPKGFIYLSLSLSLFLSLSI